MSTEKENKTKEVLEYFDLFGTKIGFYAEGKPKFYTAFGGILSIISILISFAFFITYSLKDLKRVSPITTSSSISSEGYRKIKFNEEKIWIPIRITDFYYNFLKLDELVYPIIQYGYGERTNLNEVFKKKYKMLNYKLCNETSMINKPDIYSINVPLNQLYCIDTDDLEIGGFWDSTFVGFLRIDLYFCKNGENYSESNPNCTTYEKINELTKNYSLKFELYYPTIQFQPVNYDNPIIILYRQYFYRVSKYSNKMARLFLQESVLTDDRGWLINNIVNSSYYGFSSLKGDDYATPETKDLMTGGSTSRFYSLYVYLEPGIILYKREYKKLLTIIVEGLPIMYVVFIIFENIAKLFKSMEENKIMIELLFENLKEKPNKFEKHLNMIKESNKELINYSRSNLPAIRLIKDVPKENIVSNISLNLYQRNDNDIIKKKEKQVNNNENENFPKNKQNREISSNKLIDLRNLHNSFNLNNNKIIYQNRLSSRTRYIAKKLFPNRFYFFSSFIKNSTINKNNCFFDNKFAKVYTFLTQIIDISAYLVLKREFNILKTEFLDDIKRNYIENNNKINVGAQGFIKNISQYLSGKNFDIFSKKDNFKK